MRKALFVCTALLLLNAAAFAYPVLFWDFENATSVGGVSTAVGTSYDPAVSGLVSQTGGGPVEEFWPGDYVFLTRFFGTYYPYITFTTAGPLRVTGLTFQHLHNHNPGFPTDPSYDVQLQLDSGSGFVNVGSPMTLSAANFGSTDTMALDVFLGPGTYTIRWIPQGLHNGSPDTNTEFFAFNDLTLNSAPEPASVLLTALGGLALLLRRRMRRA